jgi:hypothetical protein
VRARDRAIGIVLGVVLGLALVIAFVFFGSRDTIDAPSISGGEATKQRPVPAPKDKPDLPRRKVHP